MAANNQIVKKSIQIDAGDTLRTVKSLKQEISDLRDELLNLEQGTEEYDEVQKQLHDDVEDLNEVMGAHKDKAEALEGSYNALQAELKELKQAWKETNDEAERDVLGQKINDLNNQLKEMDASIGDFHRNVGNYQSAWQGLTGVMENGEKVTDDLEKGIKAFGTAMGLSEKQVKGLSDVLKRMKDGFKIAKDIAKAKDEATKLAAAEQTAAAGGTALATSQTAAGAAAKTMAAGEVTAAGATKGLSLAMKGLKAALVSTGIGAIVVLVGELAANFDGVYNSVRRLLGLKPRDTGEDVDSYVQRTNDDLDKNIRLLENERDLLDHNLEMMEAAGATELEILEQRKRNMEHMEKRYRELFDLTKEVRQKLRDKAPKDKDGNLINDEDIEKLNHRNDQLKEINKHILEYAYEVRDAGWEIDVFVEKQKHAADAAGNTLKKWSELILEPKFRQAWKDLFEMDFVGDSPIEVLKAQMVAATALVAKFKGDTSEVENLFKELISDAEDEWRSLAEKEQQIFDERLTPAQRLENEKAMWVELANKWGMDAVNIVKYYDAKIKEENKKAEDAITAQQEAAEAERLAELDKYMSKVDAALATQEKMNELFNPVYEKKTVADEIQQDMDRMQALYDTQMEYLNGLLESADLVDGAYEEIENRILELTVTFNTQMNKLKAEQDYQGKNLGILTKKQIANFQNLEDAAAGFADAFQAIGKDVVMVYKGFATAQALIAAFLAFNEVLAAEPGEFWTKMAAALGAFGTAVANVMSIIAVNPDGSNASSLANQTPGQSATPVIGNARPINYTRNITTAAEEDEMNQPIYVTVTDIEEGLEGQRVRVQNSSF